MATVTARRLTVGFPSNGRQLFHASFFGGPSSSVITPSERIGSLAPGRLADLIAVPGDPLKNLTVLAQVGFVMTGGEMYREDLIQHSRG